MDDTKILEHDHRDAEKLFSQIEKADGTERQSLIDELNTAFRALLELEETVLYPMMEPVTGAEDRIRRVLAACRAFGGGLAVDLGRRILNEPFSMPGAEFRDLQVLQEVQLKHV